ncbi:MAG: alpha/beta fold hydrolase [Steroidobacteraceae bacterium]
MMWAALICGAYGGCSPPAAASLLTLAECRLEHPEGLASSAARCGSLEVAEDPTNAAGPAITLRVAVVKALNRRSTAAPLFVLAGGPGQSAIDLYTSAANAFVFVSRNHDIVLIDQRGTGGSGPLACDYPEDWEIAGDDLPQLRETTRRCLAKFGERVRFYTTAVAVDDLDQVRRALGYSTIDLYGSSYGTRVAEMYLRRHPETTNAVILDGVIDPMEPIGPETPSIGERALNRIIERCEETRDCSTAYPLLSRNLRLLRQRFGPEKTALVVSDPGSGLPLRMDFGRDVFNAALRFLSYNSIEASLLPALIDHAAKGDLAPLAAQTVMMSRRIGRQLASAMQNSVICSEDLPFFAISDEARRRIASTYQGSDQLLAVMAICALWPRGPIDENLHSPLNSDVPALLLSGEADPVTPPEAAARTARGFTHQRLVTLYGEGHGQLATGCVPKLMADFLNDPAPEKLDTTCLARHRPAPFFVDLNGPSP